MPVTDEKPRIQGRMNSRLLEYLTSCLPEFKSSLIAAALRDASGASTQELKNKKNGGRPCGSTSVSQANLFPHKEDGGITCDVGGGNYAWIWVRRSFSWSDRSILECLSSRVGGWRAFFSRP